MKRYITITDAMHGQFGFQLVKKDGEVLLRPVTPKEAEKMEHLGDFTMVRDLKKAIEKAYHQE